MPPTRVAIIGTGATSVQAVPHLAKACKELLVFQRTDERPEGTIMKTVAHELTEQHIHDVATYLQAMPNM